MTKLEHISHSRVLFVIVTIALAISIYFISADQFEVTIYKLSLTSLAAMFGYWIDLLMFQHFRPKKYIEKLEESDYSLGTSILVVGMQLRRALIILAVTLSVGLGL